MPLSEVSEAVYDYFNNNIESVPNLGVIYRSLPKIASESDLFTNSYSGLGLGAAIYMFFEQQSERRIALGGPPPPYGGGGVKWRDYTLSLLIVFKSDQPQTIDGQIAYMAFIDGLTGIIEANRTAGTDNAIYGGNGTATVFQWGEGGTNGGTDIQIQHYVPRTLDGGVTLFQGLARVNVCETLQT
jgi:hypothetical protein